MNNDDKILKILESMDKRLNGLEQGQQEQGKDIKSLRGDVRTVDMKVEAFNAKLDATAKEIKEEIKAAIEREAKASADMFFNMSEKLDKQEELEKRIERLEKHAGLSSTS
jgi:uncharacterized coiled-coil protein SlyX